MSRMVYNEGMAMSFEKPGNTNEPGQNQESKIPPEILKARERDRLAREEKDRRLEERKAARGVEIPEKDRPVIILKNLKEYIKRLNQSGGMPPLNENGRLNFKFDLPPRKAEIVKRWEATDRDMKNGTRLERMLTLALADVPIKDLGLWRTHIYDDASGTDMILKDDVFGEAIGAIDLEVVEKIDPKRFSERTVKKIKDIDNTNEKGGENISVSFRKEIKDSGEVEFVRIEEENIPKFHVFLGPEALKDYENNIAGGGDNKKAYENKLIKSLLQQIKHQIEDLRLRLTSTENTNFSRKLDVLEKRVSSAMDALIPPAQN